MVKLSGAQHSALMAVYNALGMGSVLALRFDFLYLIERISFCLRQAARTIQARATASESKITVHPPLIASMTMSFDCVKFAISGL